MKQQPHEAAAHLLLQLRHARVGGVALRSLESASQLGNQRGLSAEDVVVLCQQPLILGVPREAVAQRAELRFVLAAHARHLAADLHACVA
jgi:hypothetical protein